MRADLIADNFCLSFTLNRPLGHQISHCQGIYNILVALLQLLSLLLLHLSYSVPILDCDCESTYKYTSLPSIVSLRFTCTFLMPGWVCMKFCDSSELIIAEQLFLYCLSSHWFVQILWASWPSAVLSVAKFGRLAKSSPKFWWPSYSSSTDHSGGITYWESYCSF